MGIVPHRVMAILGGILAERREHNTVLQSDTANPQRGEELGNGLPIGLGVGCCTSWRDLGGSKVGDLFEIRIHGNGESASKCVHQEQHGSHHEAPHRHCL